MEKFNDDEQSKPMFQTIETENNSNSRP
jgi:hypothetical protein